MTIAWLCRASVTALLSTTFLGCALFTKSDSVVLRYFTPEAVGARPEPSSHPVAGAGRHTNLELRMGKIDSASYVKDRIAFRDENFEVGYYEELRWTEKPESYLRRALARGLFEEQGIHQIVSGPGTTMDVELDAFEELRAPRHAARVQVTWALRDDQRVQVQETFVIERPIAAAGRATPEVLAAAMALAFDAAVERVVTGVVAALASGTSSSASR